MSEGILTEAKRDIILRRRSFYLLVISLLVLIALMPIGVYWYTQTVDLHVRWDSESNFAHVFFFDTSDVAYQMKGNFGPWDNVSRFYGGEEMFNAGLMIYYLSNLDVSHRNQLLGMESSIDHFRESSGAFCGLPTYCQNITASQRMLWSTQLLALSNKVYNAYNNYLNYSSTNSGVGPPLWYSGPSPTDERDLQDAVLI